MRDILGRGPAYSRPFHPTRNQRGKGGGARTKGVAEGGTSASRSNLLFPGIKGKHLSNTEELDWFKGQREEGVKPVPLRQAVFRIPGPSRGW